MYCPNCGNQLSDGARFCSRCGNDVSGDSPTQRIPRPEMQPEYQQDAPEPPDSGKRTTKIILIVAIIAVIAVIVVAGSILIRNNVETQRAARDAQQALQEAEEKSAMYGSAVPETEAQACLAELQEAAPASTIVGYVSEQLDTAIYLE